MTDINGLISERFEKAHPTRAFMNREDLLMYNHYGHNPYPQQPFNPHTNPQKTQGRIFKKERPFEQYGWLEEVNPSPGRLRDNGQPLMYHSRVKPKVPTEAELRNGKNISYTKYLEAIKDPWYAIEAAKNIKEAQNLDGLSSSVAQQNAEAARNDPVMNATGIDRPRSITYDFNEDGYPVADVTETEGLTPRELAEIGMDEINEGDFMESQTDINARMSAWHDASQHPERAGEFLRGYHIVNDKAVDTVKDSISPNGEIKESANETDPKEFMPAMADAAAEDAMDDFEAQGVKHMMDTKKERAKAVKPIVQDDDKVRGAEVVGHDSTVSPEKGVTGMDVDVDTSSYLEDLMGRGLITPEQYIWARQAFKDGRDRGLPERMDKELMKRLGAPVPDELKF